MDGKTYLGEAFNLKNMQLWFIFTNGKYLAIKPSHKNNQWKLRLQLLKLKLTKKQND